MNCPYTVNGQNNFVTCLLYLSPPTQSSLILNVASSVITTQLRLFQANINIHLARLAETAALSIYLWDLTF